ncbi:MAG TPA: winged helix-turn-helix domain-containing protein [Nitrososphaeraceae archaeon]|nr:winged helix-turn-helix domain-containing protein [Nitrososphaeraceae archaeon]
MCSGAEGVSRTSIMYESFLSHAQLKEYLSLLLESNLIEELPNQIKSDRLEILANFNI